MTQNIMISGLTDYTKEGIGTIGRKEKSISDYKDVAGLKELSDDKSKLRTRNTKLLNVMAEYAPVYGLAIGHVMRNVDGCRAFGEDLGTSTT